MKTLLYLLLINLLPVISKGQLQILPDSNDRLPPPFNVKIRSSNKDTLPPPKYILDGKLIEDTSVIMKLNPKDIEKIEILRNSNNKYDHGFYRNDYIVITTKHSDKKIKENFNSGKQILISSGQLSPSKEITINNYKFDLVEKKNDTLYLSTADEGFTTHEGYKVGMRWVIFPRT